MLHGALILAACLSAAADSHPPVAGKVVSVRFVRAEDVSLPQGASWSGDEGGVWEACEWPEGATPPLSKEVASVPLDAKEPVALALEDSARHLNWFHAYALEHKHIPATAAFSKLSTAFLIRPLPGKDGGFWFSFTPRLAYDTGSHKGEILAEEAAFCASGKDFPSGGFLLRPKHPLPKRMLRALAGGAEGGALFFAAAK